MKYLIIFSFIIFSFNKVFSQTNAKDSLTLSINKDSLVKYSKEWFIQNYGEDDNSKALIEFYFFKYRDYKRYPLNSLFIIVPSSPLLLVTKYSRSDGLDLKPVLYVIFGSAILIAVGGIIYYRLNIHKYDTENLLNTLKEYHKTRDLPKKLKRNLDFNKTLRIIQDHNKLKK